MKNEIQITPTSTVREVRQELFKYDSLQSDNVRRRLFEKDDQDAPVGLYYFAEAKAAIEGQD